MHTQSNYLVHIVVHSTAVNQAVEISILSVVFGKSKKKWLSYRISLLNHTGPQRQHQLLSKQTVWQTSKNMYKVF